MIDCKLHLARPPEWCSCLFCVICTTKILNILAYSEFYFMHKSNNVQTQYKGSIVASFLFKGFLNRCYFYEQTGQPLTDVRCHRNSESL